MRCAVWVRRHEPPKPKTCPERLYIYAAGISVKVSAQYPGRSVILPRASVVERRREEVAEVSRGHSRHSDGVEGPNA